MQLPRRIASFFKGLTVKLKEDRRLRFVLVILIILLIVAIVFCTVLLLLHKHTFDVKTRTLPLYTPDEVKTLNCAQYFEENANFTEYKEARYVYEDPQDETNFPMDCDSIKNRSRFQTEDLYPEERTYPIAFAKAVYQHYRYNEMELASTYAPQNFYCYALDAKSSPLFHKRMKALSRCFPNVVLTTNEFTMDSRGHNLTRSNYECMKTLAKKEWNWKYLILLQNNDFVMKTNQELIRILELLNGTNEVGAYPLPDKYRYNPKLDWSFKALHLFKNELRNTQLYNGFKPEFKFVNTLSENALSREAVEFMLNDLNLVPFINQVNTGGYGVDEIFMSTINTNDAIAMPGGFTEQCFDRGQYADSYVRFSRWTDGECLTGKFRHYNCIFGMENLREISKLPFLLGNKFMPDFDIGALACWHEKMYNRTHLERGVGRLTPHTYLDLPHVRFNRERREQGTNFDPRNFNCSLTSSTGSDFRNTSLFLIVIAYFVHKCL